MRQLKDRITHSFGTRPLTSQEVAKYIAFRMRVAGYKGPDIFTAAAALAIANTMPATVYVGTVDRGLLASRDGLSWTSANQGLGMAPGARLQIDDVAVDPAQPQVLYVASSYLYGSTQVHATPSSVAMSTDGAQAWTPLAADSDLYVAELMPVSGVTGAAPAMHQIMNHLRETQGTTWFAKPAQRDTTQVNAHSDHIFQTGRIALYRSP